MANYIVSYDLNGTRPTHAEMDEHIKASSWASGRILETVWYIGTASDLQTVYGYVNQILSGNDSLLVVDANTAMFRNLLVQDSSFQGAWANNT